MSPTKDDARLGGWASIATAAGVLLSGPLAMLFLHVVAPQPDWTDGATLVEHYRRVQMLPYVLGVILIAGATTMTAALAQTLASGLRRDLVRICLSAFVTMIGLNYVIQTTFVPSVVATHGASGAQILEHVSMGSPYSLAWALEMWGYAFLGAATWLVAPALRATSLERAASGLCVANGVLAIGGGVLTAYRLEWVFSGPGFACFATWNAVMLALAVVSHSIFRERAGARADALIEGRP